MNARIRDLAAAQSQDTARRCVAAGVRLVAGRGPLLQGATETHLTTVSYGEERPAVEGTDETAFARNRRVEILFSAP